MLFLLFRLFLFFLLLCLLLVLLCLLRVEFGRVLLHVVLEHIVAALHFFIVWDLHLDDFPAHFEVGVLHSVLHFHLHVVIFILHNHHLLQLFLTLLVHPDLVLRLNLILFLALALHSVLDFNNNPQNPQDQHEVDQ